MQQRPIFANRILAPLPSWNPTHKFKIIIHFTLKPEINIIKPLILGSDIEIKQLR